MKARLRGLGVVSAPDAVVCVMVPMNRDKRRAWENHLRLLRCTGQVCERVGTGTPSAYLVSGPSCVLAELRKRTHPYVTACLESKGASVRGSATGLAPAGVRVTNDLPGPADDMAGLQADAQAADKAERECYARADRELPALVADVECDTDTVRECLRCWFQVNGPHASGPADLDTLALWSAENVDFGDE